MLSMNKQVVMALVAVSIVMGTAGLPVIKLAYAQYGSATGGNIEEQLQLAKEKVQNAKVAGAYGSGTPMLGVNIDQTAIFVGVLVAIFGGVAAAFFAMSRSKRSVGATS
ncbi:MAG TPA: hypothetical protein VF884_05615 [Nitrososphaeraceae archaeon]